MTTATLEETRTLAPEVSISPRYLVSPENGGVVRPLRVGREPGGDILPVFGSFRAARIYLISSRLGPEWRVRAVSDGELASLLSGPCQGIRTIAIDPRPYGLPGKGLKVARADFLHFLLGDRDAAGTVEVPID